MMEFLEIDTGTLIRVALGALLGALVGLERDKHGRAAGMRTHMLVSLGAAVFVVLSHRISMEFRGEGYFGDPGRIAAQVVTGIGFLGAGVILKSGGSVRGLTTAACLWAAAAIGMASGSGHIGLALLTTALAMVGLVLLKPLEHLYAKDSYRLLTIVLPRDFDVSKVVAAIPDRHLKILNCDIAEDRLDDTTELRLTIRIHHKGLSDGIARQVIQAVEATGAAPRRISWARI